ncbi:MULTISPECIES: hypothetical protein [unclassified Micromonospora]|nr:hypothetical protein [Micromonospora sp. CB01531]
MGAADVGDPAGVGAAPRCLRGTPRRKQRQERLDREGEHDA